MHPPLSFRCSVTGRNTLMIPEISSRPAWEPQVLSNRHMFERKLMLFHARVFA